MENKNHPPFSLANNDRLLFGMLFAAMLSLAAALVVFGVVLYAP